MERPLPMLLIEDDDVDRALIMRYLIPHQPQFTVTATADANQALTLLASPQTDFAIIVLDLNLPGLSGFEFLHTLRQNPHYKASLVIVLTGTNSDQDRSQAQAYDVAAYLVKDALERHCTQLITLLDTYRRDCHFQRCSQPLAQSDLVFPGEHSPK